MFKGYFGVVLWDPAVGMSLADLIFGFRHDRFCDKNSNETLF